MSRPGLTQSLRRLICVSGVDGGESNRPATNFPGISVDSNRFDCLVEKVGLGVKPWRKSPAAWRGFYFRRSKTGVWGGVSVL